MRERRDTGPPSGRRALIVTALCLVVTLAVGIAARPVPDRLPEKAIGDQKLADLARGILGGDQHALAVACVTAETRRTAVLGAAPTDRFEAGSISKGVTGLLFADMIDRGEVDPGDRLGTYLPVDGDLGQVTLAQLATHTSGLPTQLPTAGQFARNLWASLSAGNPYRGSVQQRLDAVRGIALDSPPGTYSNLGFELLGAALAAAAGQPYRDLVRERILLPVGLTEATYPYADSELTERDLRGETAGGRTSAAWLGEAFAPAGGLRADIDQTATFTQRLLTGRAPGMDALKPKVTEDGVSTGWAWITIRSPYDDRPVTWHNGGTGGFTSFLGIDPERGTGVVLLTARAQPVNDLTRAGYQLLDRPERDGGCG